MLTDIEMPGSLDGIDLAWMIRALWPTLPVVITSGKHLPKPGTREFSGKWLCSVVADGGQRPIEVGLVGREGMTGVASSWAMTATPTKYSSRPLVTAVHQGGRIAEGRHEWHLRPARPWRKSF